MASASWPGMRRFDCTMACWQGVSGCSYRRCWSGRLAGWSLAARLRRSHPWPAGAGGGGADRGCGRVHRAGMAMTLLERGLAHLLHAGDAGCAGLHLVSEPVEPARLPVVMLSNALAYSLGRGVIMIHEATRRYTNERLLFVFLRVTSWILYRRYSTTAGPTGRCGRRAAAPALRWAGQPDRDHLQAL